MSLKFLTRSVTVLVRRVKPQVSILRLQASGFTVIEMIVIIAIIGIISATVVFSDKDASRRREITLEAQKLAQKLRRAQNMALSSQMFVECGNKVVPYGIFLYGKAATDRYYLVADCDENNVYNSSGGDVIIERIFYSKNINTSSVSPATPPLSKLDIFFIPPVPTTMVNNNASFTSAIITLCHLTDISICKTVQINEKGAINVQ